VGGDDEHVGGAGLAAREVEHRRPRPGGADRVVHHRRQFGAYREADAPVTERAGRRREGRRGHSAGSGAGTCGMCSGRSIPISARASTAVTTHSPAATQNAR
jgi:hypothetical protein